MEWDTLLLQHQQWFHQPEPRSRSLFGKVRAGARQFDIQRRSRLREPEKVTPSVGAIKQPVNRCTTTLKKRGEKGTSILFHSLFQKIEAVCIKQNHPIKISFNRYLLHIGGLWVKTTKPVLTKLRAEESSVCLPNFGAFEIHQ